MGYIVFEIIWNIWILWLPMFVYIFKEFQLNEDKSWGWFSFNKAIKDTSVDRESKFAFAWQYNEYKENILLGQSLNQLLFPKAMSQHIPPKAVVLSKIIFIS